VSCDRNVCVTHVVWPVGLLIGSAVALGIETAIGNQDLAIGILIVGAAAGVLVAFSLEKDYWVRIHFRSRQAVSSHCIGRAIIRIARTCLTTCSVMFFLRFALEKEKLIIRRPTRPKCPSLSTSTLMN
jgi:hypothetical protein